MESKIRTIPPNIKTPFFLSEVVYLTILYRTFCLIFHLTGENFRGELQDVGGQKIKCGPIRTSKITGIRLLDELYVNITHSQ